MKNKTKKNKSREESEEIYYDEVQNRNFLIRLV